MLTIRINANPNNSVSRDGSLGQARVRLLPDPDVRVHLAPSMQQRRPARFSKSVDAENFLNLFLVPSLLFLCKRRLAVPDRTFAYEAVVRVGPSDALGLEPVDIFPHPIERAPSGDLEQVL